MGPADVAKAWRANYESAAEHVDYVREHFDAEVSEGLMLKLDEDAFWGKYGDEAALSAIAVLVDEGPPEKKRVIHDASHEVMLNHRIKCLDKVRSPGAREKRYLLRFLKDHRCAALSVTGDISKAHRRFRHSPDEWGYLGCKASDIRVRELCGDVRGGIGRILVEPYLRRGDTIDASRHRQAFPGAPSLRGRP